MSTHDVRFVWLKVQSETEWNSHGNIQTYIGIIFGQHIGIVPRSSEKGQQRNTNLDLLKCIWILFAKKKYVPMNKTRNYMK